MAFDVFIYSFSQCTTQEKKKTPKGNTYTHTHIQHTYDTHTYIHPLEDKLKPKIRKKISTCRLA